jgi:DNA polymerase III, delta subunit
VSIEALERELPPATLLLGPDRLACWKLATRMITSHGVAQCDCLRIAVLSAVQARVARKFAGIAPFVARKVIVACTDGARAQAQNILLKVLEEPPPAVSFILIATSRPLPTIVSRCQVITVPGEGGQPEADSKVTAQVAAALTAAAAGNLRGLDTALAGWGDKHHAELEAQLAKAAAGGSRVLTPALSRRLLGALGRFSGAQPRLAAHAALVTILSDKEQHA